MMGKKCRSPQQLNEALPVLICWLLAERYQQFFAAQCLVITPPVWVTSPCAARLSVSRHNALGEPMGEVFQFAALFENSMMAGIPRH